MAIQNFLMSEDSFWALKIVFCDLSARGRTGLRFVYCYLEFKMKIFFVVKILQRLAYETKKMHHYRWWYFGINRGA